MFVLLLVTVSTALLLKWLLKPEPSPIFSIYSQPGRFYYLKYAFFYLLFSLRKVFVPLKP